MPRNRTAKHLVVYLLAMIYVGAGRQAGANPPHVTDSPIFKGFHERWTRVLTSIGAPGFSVVVVKDDELILLDGFGTRDAESGAPVTPDTMFYIASATKPFNAMAALALAEDGKLALDKPVKQYLPHFALPGAALTSTLTPHDLMCHQYGINKSEIVYLDAYSGQITDDAYFRLLRSADISNEVDYSNVHYTLLGRVIRAVSGDHWRDFVESRILQPAGMRRTTGYASRMYADTDVAYPHIQVDGKWRRSPVIKTDRTMHAAGGMGTTARDAGRWLRLNMKRGEIDGKRIVSTASMAAMLKSQSKMKKPIGRIRQRQGFGLGWGLGTYRGRPYAFHGGGYVGSAAYMSFLPEENIGVAILVNSAGTGHALTDIVSIDIYDKLLGLEERDLLPIYEKKAPSFRKNIDTSELGNDLTMEGGLSLPVQAFLATFRHDDWGTVETRHENDRLVVKCGDLHGRLVATGEVDVFQALIMPGEPANGRFIVRDGDVEAVELDVLGETVRFTRQ